VRERESWCLCEACECVCVCVRESWCLCEACECVCNVMSLSVGV